MDKKNIIILGFAIVAIGLFVIPSTMSMFVGQHQWYSVRTVEKQYVLCERCHQAEVGEWVANEGAHASYRDQNLGTGCFCHQINDSKLLEYGFDQSKIDFDFEVFNETGNLTNSSNTWGAEWRTNATPHAAITIGCDDCHYNATTQLMNPNSAHRQFFILANASDYGTNNTACMACHTMIGLNITIERIKSGIEVDATHLANYTWSVIVDVNETEKTNTSTYYPPAE